MKREVKIRGPVVYILFLGLSLTTLLGGCTSKLTGADPSSNGPGTGSFSLQALHKTNSLKAVCSIKVPDPEPADLARLATITGDEATRVALAAFPGTTALHTELDNENGCLVFGVQLDSGADVKVDAGNAVMLYADTGTDDGTEHEDGTEQDDGK